MLSAVRVHALILLVCTVPGILFFLPSLINVLLLVFSSEVVLVRAHYYELQIIFFPYSAVNQISLLGVFFKPISRTGARLKLQIFFDMFFFFLALKAFLQKWVLEYFSQKFYIHLFFAKPTELVMLANKNKIQ